MPGFDRSKIKATSMAILGNQEKEQETKRPSQGNFDRNYLTISPGDNKFRIFPAHPDGGGKSFTEPKCVSFLSVKTPVRGEDKKPTGEFEIKRRPVFNSKVHGNLPNDLVETYLEVAKKIAIPDFTDDDETRKKIWGKITGRDGMKPQDTWVVYAAKIEDDGSWTFGLLDLKKSIKAQLTERALEFTSGDVQSPDPYSDPDDGICIVINKSGKDLDTEYKVSLETKKVGKFNTEYVPTPIPDDMLEQWVKCKSLYELYVNVFTKKDFELQLDGLQRFDQELAKLKWPIRVLERPEFLQVVDQLVDLVREPDQEEEEEGAQEDSTPPPAPKKVGVKSAPIAPTPKPAPKPKPVVVQKQEEEEEEEEQIGHEEEVSVPQTESIEERIKRIRQKAGMK